MVLSPLAYNRTVGLALLCPITSRVKGYPFEVALPPGLPVRGVVLADQIKSLDWRARRAEVLAPLPTGTLDEILRKAGFLLGRDD